MSLISVPAAQEQLGGISRTTVERLVKSGELESVKVERRRMILEDSIQAYIEKCISSGRMKVGQ